MKKYQKLFMIAAETLGLTAKVKEGTLTASEQQAIFAEYEKTNGRTFAQDREANEDAEAPTVALSAEEQQAIANALDVAPAQAPQTAPDAINSLISVIGGLRSTIADLGSQTEAEPQSQPMQSAKRVNIFGTAHTATHLFGIESPIYALNKTHNKLMLDRKVAEMSETEQAVMMQDLSAFVAQAQNRLAQLVSNGSINMLNLDNIVKGESLNYDQLESVAGEYITRRTDAIFAFIRTLPTVTNIFPRVSNVQNKMIAPTAAFGELSQGYRKGNFFKGNAEFGAEMYEVTDLMFKFDLDNLVEIERQYIGYLNREGSDVIKWTFIEWLVVYFGEKLIAEQNRRNVYGYRVPQQNVISNKALLSADGVYAAIMKAEEANKVLPFSTIGTYSESDMLTVVEAFADELFETLDSVEGYNIYLNKRHQRWYTRAYRAKYGQNTDFSGASATPLIDLSPESIIWVPNMPANSYKIFAAPFGTLELLEDKPGEMLNFYFHRELEGVTVISRWKEGASATYAGKKFDSKAALIADKFAHQRLFTNDATTEVAIAATMDLSANDQFVVTKASEEAFAGVTTVTGTEADRVYKFVATAAGASLPKTGVFSEITSAWTAGAAGDYIKVYAQLSDSNGVTVATGKFLELERKVTA